MNYDYSKYGQKYRPDNLRQFRGNGRTGASEADGVFHYDGDYIVSIIDGMANIKKYRLDEENNRIALLSESTQEYAPIFIHRSDDFRISGKVVEVIKRI